MWRKHHSKIPHEDEQLLHGCMQQWFLPHMFRLRIPSGLSVHLPTDRHWYFSLGTLWMKLHEHLMSLCVDTLSPSSCVRSQTTEYLPSSRIKEEWEIVRGTQSEDYFHSSKRPPHSQSISLWPKPPAFLPYSFPFLDFQVNSHIVLSYGRLTNLAQCFEVHLCCYMC